MFGRDHSLKGYVHSMQASTHLSYHMMLHYSTCEVQITSLSSHLHWRVRHYNVVKLTFSCVRLLMNLPLPWCLHTFIPIL